MAIYSMASIFASTILVLPVLSAPTWSPWSASSYKHVIAISVDGMHASDLDMYVALKPKSTFAKLLQTGVEYSNAYTSAVSTEFSVTPESIGLTSL